MAQLNFDASQVAPNTGNPDPIPAGWYNAQIDESEMKPTKDGTGTYLQLRFSVVEGQYANRKVYARLNLRNSNPVAQEIAYGELSAICHATGVMQLQDSQQLHGIPMKIKVKLRAASGDYDASNEIGSYKHINEQVGDAGAAPAGGVPAGFGNQAPQQQQPAQQPAQNQQPWAQQQAPQQQAPQQMPAEQQAPQGQQWQQPAAQQPWQQQPAQQQAPQQQPAQQAQQPAQQQPVQQPAQQQPQTTAQPPAGNAGMPPWAQGQG